MSDLIKLHVKGDFACFTRPEMKVERVSYDIITPSAARGILEAIYWKPQFTWVIKKIHLLSPIQFTSVRRNEVGKKVPSITEATMAGESKFSPMDIVAERKQRASLLLRNVSYGIEATVKIRSRRFEEDGPDLSINANVRKHLAQFERRAKRGAHFHQPYFGNREFPAYCTWIDQDSSFPAPKKPIPETDLNRELGYMLHDFDFAPSTDKEGTFIESNQGRRIKATPRFFSAKIINGTVTVPPLEQALS